LNEQIRSNSPSFPLEPGAISVIHTRLGLAASILLFATVAAASDWSDQVRHVVPSGVTLTQLEETPGTLRIVGHANGNADVAHRSPGWCLPEWSIG
jgi:hypothetical protein